MKNYSNYSKTQNYRSGNASVRAVRQSRRTPTASQYITLTVFAAVVLAVIAVVGVALTAFAKESSKYYILERSYSHCKSAATAQTPYSDLGYTEIKYK